MKTGKLKVLVVLAVLVLGAGSYQLWKNRTPTAETGATAETAALADPGADAIVEEGTPPPNEVEVPSSEEGLPTGSLSQQQPDSPPPFVPPPAPVADYDDDELAESGSESSAETMAEFAQDLSGLMERALESEKDAVPAFAELERCASDTDDQGNTQAQLICFANASRLSKEYPGLLGNRFVSLAKQNPKLVGMLENTGLE